MFMSRVTSLLLFVVKSQCLFPPDHFEGIGKGFPVALAMILPRHFGS